MSKTIKKGLRRLPVKERIALALLLAMLVTNPLTGQYVATGIDKLFGLLFGYGSYVSIVGATYVLGLGVFYYARDVHYVADKRVKLPGKGVATQTQAYIET
jgi:hypothetical protein